MASWLPLVTLAFAATFAYGWACLLLPRGRRHWLTLAVVTLGLSLGALTLVMFWIAWVWPGRLHLVPTIVSCLALSALGLFLSRRDLAPDPEPSGGIWRASSIFPLSAALLAVIVMVSAAIVFNAAYWPFTETDALAIYALLAKRIYETGALPFGSLYEGYPMMVPLAYAYTHWAAGGVNEYWARLVPALMALGAIGAAVAFASEARSRRAGLLAGGVVVLTPIFARWASSGYADVPASFFLTLAALAAWRWLRSQSWQDAILTGVASAFAMWTKSSTLTLGVSLACIVLLNAWLSRRNQTQEDAAPFRWGHVPGVAAAILAMAGPWYARNLAVFGFLLPDTAWTEQAQPDVTSIVVFVRDWGNFGVMGWAFAAGVAYALAKAVRTTARRTSEWAVTFAFALPFFAAWWGWASYDVRFLVTIVPILSVIAAIMIEGVWERLAAGVPTVWPRRGAWAAGALVLALALPSLQVAVQGKRAIAQDPWMNDWEKHSVRLGGVFELAQAINRLPDGSRVLGVPALSVYHVDRSHTPGISAATSDAPPWDLASRADYVVYDFRVREPAPWTDTAAPVLATEDGYYLYSTHPGAE